MEQPLRPADNWTDNDWNKFKKWLKGILIESTVTVTFIKKDGSERVMVCTLNPSMLPIIENKTNKIKKPNDDTLSVFDIEKNSWRSFTYKSIKRIQLSL